MGSASIVAPSAFMLYNIAIGGAAMKGCNITASATAFHQYNIAIGQNAGFNLSGSNNIIISSNTVNNADFVESVFNIAPTNNSLMIGNTLFGRNIYSGNQSAGGGTRAGRFGINTDNPLNALDVLGNISCSVITASLLLVTSSFAVTASYIPTLSSSNDAYFNGVQFGRGLGSISTNTIIGTQTLTTNSASYGTITAVGYQAVQTVTSGSGNANAATAFGYQAMQNITGNGNACVAVGYQALSNISASATAYNTAVGYQALSSSVGPQNTAVGGKALSFTSNVNGQNTAVGYLSQTTQTATGNTSVGANTLILSPGNYNTVIGINAGQNMQSTSSNNIAIGQNALLGNATSLSSSTYNIAIGTFAGQNSYASASTTNNIYIGNRAGINSSGSSNIVLGGNTGASFDVPVIGGSNQLVIANAIYGTNIYTTGSTKVGINMTTPANTLDVQGNISASVITASVAAVTSSGYIFTGSLQNGSFTVIESNGVALLYYKTFTGTLRSSSLN
jgi:hypothetical protein